MITPSQMIKIKKGMILAAAVISRNQFAVLIAKPNEISNNTGPLNPMDEKKKTKPFASIIIPTYNQAEYLKDALDSLLSQTDQDWEAVVVNDGSTDDTKRILEEYRYKDTRIRCFHQENGGVARALNVGLKQARGEWVHWLSSDDLFEPEKLTANRRWINKYPQINFFFSYFTLLRQSSGELDRRGLWGPEPEPEHQILTLFYRNYISGISVCIRRSAWAAVGNFNTELRYAQDYDQWLRLLSKNKACFIPEWTVISRNHAEQGSETFPDACYFDTAKAAIRFLNRHTFAELVPWVNLKDPVQVKAAVVKALDVACDRSSFIYSMGVHPGLIMRVLEWVFADGGIAPDISRLVQNRLRAMSFASGEDDWCWMWQQLALSLSTDNPNFVYAEIDPIGLSLQQWSSMVLDADIKHEAIRNYLLRFDGIDPQAVRPEPLNRSRVAFFLPENQKDMETFTTVAKGLAKFGLRPTIVLEDQKRALPSLRWIDGIAIISVDKFDRKMLPWLGEVELAVTPFDKLPPWISAFGHLQFKAVAEDLERLVLDIIRPEQTKYPVVFLQRVLWGGGAERVVYDVARHLDRRSFAPKIYTMFEEHVDGPEWPSHIVREQLHPPIDLLASAAQNSILSPIAIIQRAYHRIIPLSLRQKLKLGQTVMIAKDMLTSRLKALVRAKASSLSKSNNSMNAVKNAADSMEFDFIAAMHSHNPNALLFAQELVSMGPDARVVSIMEEAAIVAYLASAPNSFRHIVTLHSLESKCLPDIYPDNMRYVAEKHLLTAACNNAEIVTVPSNGCGEDLIENFNISPSLLRTVSNPIDYARILHLSEQLIPEVERWVINNPDFRMVFVGRLDPQKNPDLLLDACALVKQKGLVFSLAIVGDGWYRHSVEKKVVDLQLQEQVEFVGEQENPFPWIKSSHALVLSSQFEAFALVLAEAMACGTPVVSVNCPVGPSEVLENGKYGILTDQTADDLAEGIERLIEDENLRETLRQRGYVRAEMFDIKNVINDWHEMLLANPSDY